MSLLVKHENKKTVSTQVKYERRSARDVNGNLKMTSEPGHSSPNPPLFSLISLEQMEYVSRVAKRHLSKLKEQQKLGEFITQQRYASSFSRICLSNNLDRHSVNHAENVKRPLTVAKLGSKPQTSLLRQVSEDGFLLNDATDRIRRLLNQMRHDTTNEDNFSNGNGIESKKGTELQQRKAIKLTGKSGNAAVLNTFHDIVPVRKSKVIVTATLTKPRQSQDTLPSPKSKSFVAVSPKTQLPPYQRRREPQRFSLRDTFPRNVNVRAYMKPAVIAVDRGTSPAVIVKESCFKPNKKVDRVDEEVVKTVRTPNCTLQKLWQQLLTIELEDANLEHNLQEFRLNSREFHRSNFSNFIEGLIDDENFEYWNDEMQPMDIAQPQGLEENVSFAMYPTSVMPAPTSDEMTVINDVSNEVVKHLMNELSFEFKDLPQAILKELFDREFLNGTTTR